MEEIQGTHNGPLKGTSHYVTCRRIADVHQLWAFLCAVTSYKNAEGRQAILWG